MSLISKFDQDPGPWRPMFYSLIVDVPVGINGEGIGSIPIYNQPFILTRITHEIRGAYADPDIVGWGIYQDGQYTITFKDEQTTYIDNPTGASANALFGNTYNGQSIPLAMPIGFHGNKTLTFTVRNLVTRGQPGELFSVQIVLHGMANLGDLRRQ